MISFFHNFIPPVVQSFLIFLTSTMTSADFSLFVVTTGLLVRSPRVRAYSFLSYICHIYIYVFRVAIGFYFVMQAYPT